MSKKLLIAVVLLLFSLPVSAFGLPDFTDLVEKQGAAVVNISSTHIVHETEGDTDPEEEFPLPDERESRSLGSGFIISSDGYIMTNAHVVDSAEGITVRLIDKREFKAKVIGVDKRTDIALIKIEATGLPKITPGDPNALKVGEWVLAIGSPFGFDNSVTAGIVSAKGRSLPQENYVPFIQTDAAVNPGNSGGPLFNMSGEVIGVNSQIYSRSGGYMGLSFAIPIDVAMEVSNQLRASGKVRRGRIGVSIQDVTRELADSFGLSKASGALVSNVEKGSAADKAGIQASDVILKFNGKTVAAPLDLSRVVAATTPGTRVDVQLWRRGEEKEVSLVVGDMQDDKQVAQKERKPSNGESVARLGMVLSELSAEQKDQLQIKGGLLVEEVKGVAARELQPGDVILAIGNEEITSLEQFNAELKRFPRGRNIALLVRRENTISYIAMKLDEKPGKEKE